MTFAPDLPWWMVMAAAVAVIGFVAWQLTRRPGRLTRQAWILRGTAVLFLLLAALRPGVPGGENPAGVADLDVFFVVDTTASMTAEDYDGGQPRLEGIRTDIRAIAEELAGAKFGLVTFDDTARVQMPLTRDASALMAGVQALSPQPTQYSRGSSVTAAGPVLRERLKAAGEQHPGRPAFVFYFGDGEDTSAGPPARLAIDSGLVNGGAVLGYGTTQGGRMRESLPRSRGSEGETDTGAYIQDRSSGEAKDAVSRINEERLRDISDELGVPYVHRESGDAPAAMLREAKAAAFRAGEGNGPGRVELYWIFALAAFVLALGEPLRHGAALRETLSVMQAPTKRKTL